MEYNYQEIEKRWQIYWKKNNIFRTKEKKKLKYYILNMFPYPSGAGLHIGHCLGYITSDIYARYKRSQGYNVLNPIGFDSFGLPAEQYAIQTNKHPFETTSQNIKKYKNQINNLGISFDWSRKICTSDPNYYHWTQWMFIQIYNSWYDKDSEKAKSINLLIKEFQKNGNFYVNASTSFEKKFSSNIWNQLSVLEKESILLKYRLAYLSKSVVNWCPDLGTVLANDEIENGRSQRGGFPVQRKKMKQWHLRISAYANRLLKGLKYIECSDSLKNLQSNWIGELTGAFVVFDIVYPIYSKNNKIIKKIKSFIHHPEYIFGMSFVVLSSEHPLSKEIAIPSDQKKVLNFIQKTKNKNISGIFTGNYVFHPFITDQKIPIFISDYFSFDNQIESIIGIPCNDKKSEKFANEFGINFIQVNFCKKSQKIFFNSGFLNGLNSNKEAKKKVIAKLIEKKIGNKITTYKIRDAIFSRQRYWGEPIPIYFKNKIPYAIPIEKLPIILPKIENFHPSDGKSPLIRAKKWAWDEKNMKIVSSINIDDKKNIFPIETDTMPSWAGSSWYYLRYMDPHNTKFFLSKEKENFWKKVDLYIGGYEHGTGHLIYSRFWHKFLKDRGWINTEEPFKKVLNQGMILNYSYKILKVIDKNIFISYGLKNKEIFRSYSYQEIYVKTNLINKKNELDINLFKKTYPSFYDSYFYLENGVFICKNKLEKMSKSKYNVVNPDHISKKYGVDIFRLYEIFLGPVTQSKCWDDKKINGIKNFINKFWNLFHKNGVFQVSEIYPSSKEYYILHHTINSIHEKMKYFSLNTIISSFMIIVNQLTIMKCNKRKILEPLVKLIAPFAPHITEEIWNKLGKKKSIIYSKIPMSNIKYLNKKDKVKYPIMFNNKLKFVESFDKNISIKEIKNYIFNHYKTKLFLKKKTIKKFIIIPNKIINILF
ncbi:class I tRNA ligase family protein [Blattabacterium cuenoti]|uniref:class I tRNA ligase family protein n=1 Tax=Blattabacterium cuenoti TaxID=1653831 RepID=UPI00163C91E7|nr:class I tRNA ligase family protein [Blattabacterium cuenoti]